MRKVILSLVALSTVAVAAPAAADPRGYGHGYGNQGGSIERQLDNIVQRVRQAESRGRISHREAASLLRRADQIDRVQNRYARNGIDRREYADLQARVNGLKQQLRFERWDRDGRRY